MNMKGNPMREEVVWASERDPVPVVSISTFPSLGAAARWCREKFSTRAEAAGSLVAILRENHSLLLEATQDSLHEICLRILGAMDHRERRAILDRAERQAAADVQSRVSSERLVSATRSLMDFPLMDGTPLRDADKKKVLINSQKFLKIGAANTASGKWLALIGKNLPNDKLVGQHFKARELAHMRNKSNA